MTRFCFDYSLKPCPFCSGEAALALRITASGPITFVSCLNCRAQSRVQRVELDDAANDVELFSGPAFRAAAHAWQQRAQRAGGEADAGD